MIEQKHLEQFILTVGSENVYSDKAHLIAYSYDATREHFEPDAVVFHEHGLNQGTTPARAERVCRALKNLHEDDMFQWPSFHEDK